MIVHVYPLKDVEPHVTVPGGCWCEPDVKDEGTDNFGGPARVMVHRRMLDTGSPLMKTWRSPWFRVEDVRKAKRPRRA